MTEDSQESFEDVLKPHEWIVPSVGKAEDSEREAYLAVEALLALANCFEFREHGKDSILGGSFTYRASNGDDFRTVTHEHYPCLPCEYFDNDFFKSVFHILAIRWDVVIVEKEFRDIHKWWDQSFRSIADLLGILQEHEN